MFQRLKGAIDSRIAEEQARQKASSSSPSRSSSTARRAPARTESPTRRQSRTREREKGDRTLTKGPDPSEFDAELSVEDDSTEPTNGDHAQEKEGPRASGDNETGQQSPQEGEEGESKADAGEKKPSIASLELPTDIRVKLRKLDKLEPRYQELLRSYRIAHARVSLIESFETSLRENTPLTSIGDPSALVEYLNQMNLKSGMVMDELKRVSSEKDTFKQRLDDAENRTNEAMEEIGKLRSAKAEVETSRKPSVQPENTQNDTQGSKANQDKTGPIGEVPTSPSVGAKKAPIGALSSPKQTSEENNKAAQESEDFFSYDSELPRLESELRQREAEVNTLRGDLAVARESTESMVQSLEQATRELHRLRDGKESHELNIKEQHASMEKVTLDLRAKLEKAEEELAALKSQQSQQEVQKPEQFQVKLDAATAKIEKLESEHSIELASTEARDRLQEDVRQLKARISEMEEVNQQTEKRNETLKGLVSNLRSQLQHAEKAQGQLASEIREKEYRVAESNATVSRLRDELKSASLQHQESEQNLNLVNGNKSITATAETPRNADSIVAGKKKNKKKKKGGKGPATNDEQSGTTAAEATTGVDTAKGFSGGADPSEAVRDVEAKLQQELETLRHLLEDKDVSIDRLRKEIRNGEDMQEEIEGLRDELLNHGDEHVEAEKKVKELQTEKMALEESVESLESEIKELRNSHITHSENSERLREDLLRELHDSKSKATTLQTDLSAAEQLAASRFKDLAELRGILQRAQPELTSLRAEVSTLRATNDELKVKAVALEKLEAKEKDLQSEILGLKREVAERDGEIKALKDRVSQETDSRMQAEDRHGDAQNDLARILVEKKNATESRDKAAKELAKAQEESNATRGRLRELEQQAVKLNRDADGLREEAGLKTAQYASAQSLMSSMRDQTNEIGTQMKEARDRCESLEEELGDTHRLLSERSREGETMRRLLADVEVRSESKLREMRERMEVAIEERDRAEDEANTIGRRRAREIEELKGKVREAERSLKRAEDDKEELERGEKDWRRRREELDERAEKSTQEVKEVRQAMGELRDALDESEKQARDLEKQKVELRRSVEETQHRLEKLQKSNKVS
ncbi:MAG: hypothetical protein M1812_002538 [Candelaria pacifica]|nr:MAG: hypothetical protein M1812_002538 [Candelaria pacifica]